MLDPRLPGNFRLAISLRVWRALPTAAQLEAALSSRFFCTMRKQLIQKALDSIKSRGGECDCTTFHLDARS